MEVTDKVQDSKVHKELWLLSPWETYQNYLLAFDDYLEIQQINVVHANVAQK